MISATSADLAAMGLGEVDRVRCVHQLTSKNVPPGQLDGHPRLDQDRLLRAVTLTPIVGAGLGQRILELREARSVGCDRLGQLDPWETCQIAARQ